MTVIDNEDPADPSPHEPRVTGAPETIWLVYGELYEDATHAEFADSGEVTWCEDSQFPSDVQYLRADLLRQQAREIALEVAAIRERIATRIEAEAEQKRRCYASTNEKSFLDEMGALLYAAKLCREVQLVNLRPNVRGNL